MGFQAIEYSLRLLQLRADFLLVCFDFCDVHCFSPSSSCSCRCRGTLCRYFVVKNIFDFGLLRATQCGAQNSTAITAEGVRYHIGVRGAKKCENRRITRLDQPSDLFDEVVRDTELVLPPGCIDR